MDHISDGWGAKCWGAKALCSQIPVSANWLHAEMAVRPEDKLRSWFGLLCPCRLACLPKQSLDALLQISQRAVSVLTLTAVPLQVCLLGVQSLDALLHTTQMGDSPVLTLTAVPLQVCLLAVQSLDALLRLAVTCQELTATVQGMPEPDPAAGALEIADGAWLLVQEYCPKSSADCRLVLSI